MITNGTPLAYQRCQITLGQIVQRYHQIAPLRDDTLLLAWQAPSGTTYTISPQGIECHRGSTEAIPAATLPWGEIGGVGVRMQPGFSFADRDRDGATDHVYTSSYTFALIIVPFQGPTLSIPIPTDDRDDAVNFAAHLLALAEVKQKRINVFGFDRPPRAPAPASPAPVTHLQQRKTAASVAAVWSAERLGASRLALDRPHGQAAHNVALHEQRQHQGRYDGHQQTGGHEPEVNAAHRARADDLHRERLRVAHRQHAGEEKLVPRKREANDSRGHQRRPGNGQRHPQEDLEMRCPVYQRRFLQVLGMSAKKSRMISTAKGMTKVALTTIMPM